MRLLVFVASDIAKLYRRNDNIFKLGKSHSLHRQERQHKKLSTKTTDCFRKYEVNSRDTTFDEERVL